MSASSVNLESYRIPLEEITLATRNFFGSFMIEDGKYCRIYIGQLSEHWQNRMATFIRLDPSVNGVKIYFREVIEMSSVFNHENIIPFIGYCDERNEMIIVYEYATNGSLADLLLEPNKRCHLTWEHRLKICIGVARGLKYLHTGIWKNSRVIHGNIRSSNILLDDNLEPKIYSFTYVVLFGYTSLQQVYGPPDVNSDFFSLGTNIYDDPIRRECGIPREESDVYSFGVVLFEILSGMLAYQTRRIGDDKPRNLINFVRRYYDDGLDNLIDLHIRDEIDGRSFSTFKEIAYKCISLNKKERPTIEMLIMTFEQALDIQNKGSASTATIWSLHNTLEHFLISLEEIKLATGNFTPESKISYGTFGNVYVGKLSERWQNRTAAIKRHDPNSYYGKSEFLNELEMISSFHNENIIPFIGYCNEGNEMIIVSEYAVHGSLDNHLYDSKAICSIKWVQRLKICLGAARGLNYLLHSGLGEQGRVIHRNVKSGKILLDDNLEAKICGFGLSKVAPRNHRHTLVATKVAGTRYYLDPLYEETSILNAESDIYSFGMVMFELLSGMLAYSERSIGNDGPQTLINLVRNYQDDGLDKLIDPYIRDDIDTGSFLAYKEIAYDCISFDLKDRPPMNRIVKRIEEVLEIHIHGAASAITIRTPQHQNLEYFRIPLTEINSAIGIRSPQSRIGSGAFGDVYKGQLSERWQNRIVAIKCLHPKSNQGEHEFRKELDMMSSFHHENIIPFIGYSDEGKERIMVYEYAINGSLDCHLEDPNKRRCLTWAQRLKICLGVAKGLHYLHSGRGEDNRVIHRDVKSGNILLDENFEAKICDFGLSKSGPINQPDSQIFTNAAGTYFYIDPIYNASGILRKESDVYSFGVVLFEMLTGMLAYDPRSFGDGNPPQYLINLVRRYYDDGLDTLVDPFIRDEIDKCSYHTFEQIAYECISLRTQDRPKMDTVIDRIEEALDFQVVKAISRKEVTKS